MPYRTPGGYYRHTGKAAEHYVHEWKASNGPLIATAYEHEDGTSNVTLYTDKGVGHGRNVPTNIMWDVCEAHARERGFDTLLSDTVDIRAYND